MFIYILCIQFGALASEIVRTSRGRFDGKYISMYIKSQTYMYLYIYV